MIMQNSTLKYFPDKSTSRLIYFILSQTCQFLDWSLFAVSLYDRCLLIISFTDKYFLGHIAFKIILWACPQY